MDLLDISRPLSAKTAPWPGDTPTALARQLSLGDGDSVNLSTITASVHNATHADAPLHYDDAGLAIDALDPAIYVGPCRVIDVTGHDPIDAHLLPPDPAHASGYAPLPPRVLFKTGAWHDDSRFPDDFPTLSPGLPSILAARGVRLIGVDVPSVDKPSSKSLPIHHALRGAGILILESLDLSRAAPGDYELIALPILIPGSDGAFVRAVLREVSVDRGR